MNFAALREDSLTLNLGEETILRFDLEGRWFSVSLGEVLYRRGLNHRVLATPRPRAGERFSESRWLDRPEMDGLCLEIQAAAAEAARAVPEGRLETEGGASREATAEALARAAAWDPARYAESAETFRRIYGCIPVLPPDLYLSMVVQVARGCPYNHCSFCTLYRDVPFHPLSAAEFQEHLGRAADFLGEGLRLRRGIFLGDANALALPMSELEDRLSSLRRFFQDRVPSPRQAEALYAFQDSFTERERRSSDYERLKRLGLKRVYVGLESGHDPTRKVLAKPGRAVMAADAICRIKDSGLSVGIMVLVGAGGRALADGHERETAALIQGLNLDAEDRVFLSPLHVAPGSPYAAWLEAMGAAPLTPPETNAQIARLRAALLRPGGPKIGRYRVEDFVPY